MTLDQVISTLSAQANLDGRGSEILAAAITLRDSKGRSLKEALFAMCTPWGVQRREKISGKWKNRSVATLQELLTNAVCLAAAQYLAALCSPRVICLDGGAAEHTAPMAPKRMYGHITEHGNGFRARIKINGTYTNGRTHPTRELAQADLNAARAGATGLHARTRDVAATLKQQLSSSSVVRRAVVQPEPATEAQNVAGAANAGCKSIEPLAKKLRSLQDHKADGDPIHVWVQKFKEGLRV